MPIRYKCTKCHHSWEIAWKIPDKCQYCGCDFKLILNDEKSDEINLDDYETESTIFNSCHPVIEKALKKGMSIKCYVWNSTDDIEKIRTIIKYAKYKYLTYESRSYLHAEPIKKKKKVLYVKSISDILTWLHGKNWQFDNDCFFNSYRDIDFNYAMFNFCGKEIKPNRINDNGNVDAFTFSWLPDWIEEKEK
jgi:hypothetical protein